MTELEKKLDALIDAKFSSGDVYEPFDTRAADIYAVALDLLARIAELEKVVDAKEIVITDLIARIVEAKVLLKTWNDAEFGADLSVEIDILELSNKTEAFLSEEEKT